MGWFTQLRLQMLPIINIETAFSFLSPNVSPVVLECIKKDYYGTSPKKYCSEHASLKEAESESIAIKQAAQWAGSLSMWKRSGPVLVLLVEGISEYTSGNCYPSRCVIRTGSNKWQVLNLLKVMWDLDMEKEKR
jgi:hypothetical protein